MTLTNFQKARFRSHLHRDDDIRDDTGAAIGGGGEVTPAANVAEIADPPSATPQAVAEKVNELIAALIAADLMEAS
jgi:hypothetical protein